jgi:hypothetical protein
MPIRSPMAEIGRDEVFVATIASGAAAQATPSTDAFSSRSSGSDSTSSVAPLAASPGSADDDTRPAAARTAAGGWSRCVSSSANPSSTRCCARLRSRACKSTSWPPSAYSHPI